jgi:hypothetical protein
MEIKNMCEECTQPDCDCDECLEADGCDADTIATYLDCVETAEQCDMKFELEDSRFILTMNGKTIWSFDSLDSASFFIDGWAAAMECVKANREGGA